MSNLICLLIFFGGGSIFTQGVEKYTVSGIMTDSLTTESLISATVYNKINSAGVTTNQYGFYSLTLPAGEVEIVYSYVGYSTQTVGFRLQKDTVINMNLASGLHLQEITVTADKSSRIQERTQMSMISVPIAQIKALPAIMGETDVIKVLQMMPGIQSGNEGSSGLHVRGGSADQNLVLLDGVPIYNISHSISNVSLFNGDAINNIETYKGGFPARYGGRVSSVLDISMKEGNMEKFHGEASTGTSFKLTLEGPIVKNRTSLIISGRRTFYDLMLKNLANEANKADVGVYFGALGTTFNSGQGEFNKIGNSFYDLTAIINHRFSDRDRVYLSAYLGDDNMNVDIDFKMNIKKTV